MDGIQLHLKRALLCQYIVNFVHLVIFIILDTIASSKPAKFVATNPIQDSQAHAVSYSSSQIQQMFQEFIVINFYCEHVLLFVT